MIGLADWYIYQHTDGRRTALRQTPTNLLLATDTEWRCYADVHGMQLSAMGSAQSIEDAIEQCETNVHRP